MSAVIAELRRGTRTTAELMASTGLSQNAVQLAIARANREGHTIVNVHTIGGRSVGLYWLQHDAERPEVRRCAAHGCETILSASNRTQWCRRHLPAVAFMLYVEQLLDEATEAEEQLELVGAP